MKTTASGRARGASAGPMSHASGCSARRRRQRVSMCRAELLGGSSARCTTPSRTPSAPYPANREWSDSRSMTRSAGFRSAFFSKGAAGLPRASCGRWSSSGSPDSVPLPRCRTARQDGYSRQRTGQGPACREVIATRQRAFPCARNFYRSSAGARVGISGSRPSRTASSCTATSCADMVTPSAASHTGAVSRPVSGRPSARSPAT